MAARIAPVNYELLHHDGLSIPVQPEARDKWQELGISKLQRIAPNLIITNNPVTNGFRSIKDDGSNPGLPLLLLDDYLMTHYHQAFLDQNGIIWERNVTE